MKKSIKYLLVTCFLLITTCNANFIKPIAHAEYNGYARIITDDTPFYSDSAGRNLLFYLPYTYYVKILREDSVFTHVEIYGTGRTAGIDGYVPTEKLYYDGLSVSSPYPQIEISVANTAVLYSDYRLSNISQYIFPDRIVNFYGQYPTGDGSYLYYVSYNNRLGYIKEADVVPFTIPNHPNELTFLKPVEPEIPPTETEEPKGEQEIPNNPATDTTLTLRILIISSLLFAGIIALVFAVKKKPSKHVAVSYYDENEYE